jgi:hypothetical protein
MDFKGWRQPDARASDKVTVTTVEGWITIGSYNGLMREMEHAFVPPSTARAVAMALIKLADEAEGVT